MNRIILAVIAVAVSAGAVNALELERTNVADILKAAQAEQIAVPAVAAPQPTLIKESFNLRVDKILQPDSCAGSFEQVNGHEPLATCDIELGYDGVIAAKAVWPMLLSTELDYKVGPDQSISCTGGFRGDAGLYGKTQVFVSLSPFRTDYAKEDFSACYKKVITGLSAKDRVLYFDVVRRPIQEASRNKAGGFDLTITRPLNSAERSGDQLSLAADKLHAALMAEIRGNRITQKDAQLAFEKESMLRQQANAQYITAAEEVIR